LLFSILDVSHDGKVSEHEFVTGVYILEHGSPHARLKLFFSKALSTRKIERRLKKKKKEHDAEEK
jgi:hypothetical protein